MALFRLSGQLIRCVLPLHDHAEVVAAANDTEPSITVTIESPSAQAELEDRDVVISHDINGRPTLSVARDGEGYRIRAHGYADYLLRDGGRDVRCVPVPGCPDHIMAQLFVDRVLPNAISTGSTPVFHASAVAFRGAAGLFLGDPGIGKSTLASALTPPAQWLCDDSAVLCIEEGSIVVQPSYPFARLFDDSLMALGASGGQRATARNDKRRLPRVRGSKARTLRAAFALGVDGELMLERLSLRDGVTKLARHLCRLDPSDRHALTEELATLEAIARSVPVFRLDFPRRYEALGRVRDAVFAALSGG